MMCHLRVLGSGEATPISPRGGCCFTLRPTHSLRRGFIRRFDGRICPGQACITLAWRLLDWQRAR